MLAGNIEDIVEKIRDYLIEGGVNLLSSVEDWMRKPTPSLIKEVLIGLTLDINIETPQGRRKCRQILLDIQSIKEKTQDNVVYDSAVKLNVLQQHGASLQSQDYFHQFIDSLAVIDTSEQEYGKDFLTCVLEIPSGKEALSFIRRSFPYLAVLKSFTFLSVLGYPIVIPDRERQVFLHRLGLVERVGMRLKDYYRFTEICEDIQRTVKYPPGHLNLIFGYFSGAVKAPKEFVPLCSSTPLCDSCPLRNYCTYYGFVGARKEKDSGSTITMREWNPDDAPREKLWRNGAASLSESELLAIILRTGTSKRTVLDVARELLSEFGTLSRIEDASITEIGRVKGIGKVKAIQIKAALELGKRVKSKEALIPTGKPISCSSDVYHAYASEFLNIKKERFIELLLDVKNRVFKKVLISQGSLNASIVHPREVFKEAIRESAASVLFIHNHPSGDPKPSQDDIIITHRLSETGDVVGIKVLDHIIIGVDSFYSFADEGMLYGK